DRTGKQTGSFGEPGNYGDLALSPDEKKLAVALTDPDSGTSDIWIYDLARSVKTRFTFGPLDQFLPLWSPDGSRLVYGSDRNGYDTVYQKPSSGAGAEEVLLGAEEDRDAQSWSRDGKFIAFENRPRKGNRKRDIWILPLEGDRKPFPLLQTEFD